MAAMRRFYEDVLGFPLLRELSPGWIEYRVGNNTLALPAKPDGRRCPTPNGSASLQLAFKVPLPKLIGAPTNLCGGSQSALTAHGSGLWTSHAVLPRSGWKSAGSICGNLVRKRD